MHLARFTPRGLVSLAATGLLACGETTSGADPDAAPVGGTAGAGGADASPLPPPGGGEAPPDAARPDPDGASPAPEDAAAGGVLADAGPVGGRPDATPPPGPDPERLIPDAAEAVCAALFRCCDEAGLRAYFDPFAASEHLAEYADRLPPDAAACPALLAEMWDRTALGSWVEAVRAGLVRIDGAALEACHGALSQASCGEPLLGALFDASCFWLQPPAGGEHQRRVFVREAAEGAACRPVRDGFGGLFYGTCDPESAFCCYAPDGGDCGFPEGEAPEGVCRTARQAGEACSQVPVDLCRTGLECGGDDTCHEPDTTPLQVGEPCIDERYELLGICQGAWCDVLDTGLCQTPRADDEPCVGAEECVSLYCFEGRCRPLTLCGGP